MTMTDKERPVVPPTEVRPKAKRRSFSAEFKRRVLAEADTCTKPGEVGALLRREGLYSSHLTEWRAVRERGELDALAPKRRGPAAAPVANARDHEVDDLKRQLAKATLRAERAEALVEIQKKVAALLATPLEGRALVDDLTFDALYAPPIRACSSRFWTPVTVASRAAQILALHNVRRVLDVGAGPGKFCLTAAAACPQIEFTGVEHRPHLVEAARLAGVQLRLENVRFRVGDVTDLPWTDFDGFYLYNPFDENVCDEEDHIDATVELSMTRYMADVRCVNTALVAAPLGICMVTYHGYGGPIPVSYELVHAERAHTDWLRVWVKRHLKDDGEAFYVEDGDHVLTSNGPASGTRAPTSST